MDATRYLDEVELTCILAEVRNVRKAKEVIVLVADGIATRYHDIETLAQELESCMLDIDDDDRLAPIKIYRDWLGEVYVNID
jgi:hypothetical protein